MNTKYIELYLNESKEILEKLDVFNIEKLVLALKNLREQSGRLFVLGLGGNASNASHAVNDFRKLCEIESYSATDNVSELTARINDDGWENCLKNWLRISKLNEKDAILILSVGGGSEDKNISVNLVKAIEYAKENKSKVFGIVGRDGGYTKENANITVVIPPLVPERVTPHTEGFQALVLHAIVSHPLLQIIRTKW
ncbi:MAG: SIS domain-containing protein [Gammaproteobacteria bacterium]